MTPAPARWALLAQLLLLGSSVRAFHSASAKNTLEATAGLPGGHRKSLGYGPAHPSALVGAEDNSDSALYASFATASPAGSAAALHAASDGQEQEHSAPRALIDALNARHLGGAAVQQEDADLAPIAAAAPHLPAPARRAAAALLAALTPHAAQVAGAEGTDARRVQWRIRPDSYVDAGSGLAHVYARAVVVERADRNTGVAAEVEIANADANINLVAATGEIASYGSSLWSEVRGAVVFAEHAGTHAANADAHEQQGEEHAKEHDVDPRLALAHFLAEASPHADFGADIGQRAGMYAARMAVAPAGTPASASASLLGGKRTQAQEIEIAGAPLTTSAVRARRAYVQVPDAASGGRAMRLVRAWRMEVPMSDNHYEVALAARPAAGKGEGEGRTLSVVDWVKSMPVSSHASHAPRSEHEQTPLLEAATTGAGASGSAFMHAAAALADAAHGGVEALLRAGAAYLSGGSADPAESASSAASASAFSGLSSDPSTTPGDALARLSFPADPLLKVFKWGYNDPTDGKRSVENGVRPHSPASPLGWHRIPAQSDPWQSGAAPGGDDDDDDDEDLRGKHGRHGKKGKKEAPVRRRTKEGKYVAYKDTRGNNVLASADPAGAGDWAGARRPLAARVSHRLGAASDSDAGSAQYIFDFPYPWRAYDRNHSVLDPAVYADASTVQLFSTCNKYHDLLWGYGFDEAAGNFQQDNLGRGGKGNDAVVAFSQDGAGVNNADFLTPPDGSHGRMRMYRWTTVTPERDGDFEEGIVIHEYSHGLSTRLTGGPANSGCLGWGASGGFGEGEGDVFATMIRRQSGDVRDWNMGEWASHQKGGIRKFPYSTNMTVDTELFADLNKPAYAFSVHAIGEVWAGMANEMIELLIAKHGFRKDLFVPLPNATAAEQADFFLTPDEEQRWGAGPGARKSKRRIPRHGNTLAVQLLVDGMKLQPCRPEFFDMRDAILQADDNLTAGNNTCEIWTAFAKRGLGVDAKIVGSTPWGGGVRTNGFAVPKQCQKKKQ